MNWTTLTLDDLKAVALGDAIDAARATAPGLNDPAAEAIADAVAAVRGAIATGNVLDADPNTVPRSLRALTARTAAFALLERVQIELNADQRATRQADLARLTRINGQREPVEAADQPIGGPVAATVPVTAQVATVAEGNAGNGRAELRGL